MAHETNEAENTPNQRKNKQKYHCHMRDGWRCDIAEIFRVLRSESDKKSNRE